MEIEIGARTDVGKVRQNNEDSFGVDPGLNLLVLCDGMGGMAAGEVASKMGVEVILEHCRQAAQAPQLPLVGEFQKDYSPQTNRLASGVRLSNETIHKASEKQASARGMGTTVVAALITGNVLSIAHVGDSRIYLFREGKLQQLTRDHSLVMEQVLKGLMSPEEAERSQMANVILRALGPEPEVLVDLDEIWVQEGDQVLLCSDGLTRMVWDDGISEVLAAASSAQQASDRLVEIANDRGGEDNVTVIVGRFKPPRLWGKLKKRAKSLLGGTR